MKNTKKGLIELNYELNQKFSNFCRLIDSTKKEVIEDFIRKLLKENPPKKFKLSMQGDWNIKVTKVP